MNGLEAAPRRPREVLLVGDSRPDAEAVQLALAEFGGGIRLSMAVDGRRGLAFLLQETQSAGASRPALILLDLNLPREGSCGLLAEIKAHAEFLSIPVLVLTASDADCDIAQLYALHANCCIVKPPEHRQLLEMLRTTLRFWLTTVTLPLAD